MRFSVTIFLLILSSWRLLATAQTPEVLILDGKKEDMFAEPLEAYFADGHPRPPLFDEPLSTGLWRGYIGTWEIQDDQLYLKSLERPTYKSVSGETIVENMDVLAIVFPKAKKPIKAEWFSGVISVPRGEMLRYVHMGFGSVFSRVLYVTLKDGKVLAKREVDNKEYGSTRSDADMQWVAMAETPATEDGAWIDARTIQRNPPKNEFKTRGIYFPPSDGEAAQLWIPDTPSTEALNFRLNSAPASASIAAGSHVEVTGVIEDQSSSAIKVDSIRELKAGETMHHQTFKAPPSSASQQE